MRCFPLRKDVDALDVHDTPRSAALQRRVVRMLSCPEV